MELLHTIILTIHIIAGLSLIGFVLLQHGKGADMGAAWIGDVVEICLTGDEHGGSTG